MATRTARSGASAWLAVFLVASAFLVLPAAAQGASLVVTVPGSGLGHVTSDTGGIDCPDTCNVTVEDGATITLAAAPASGYLLGVPDPQGRPVDESGWFGCSPVQGDPLRCTVQVPASGANVEVSFRPAALLLVIANGGGGAITATVPDPQVGETDEQTCVSAEGGGAVCPFPYLPGRAVTLTPSSFAAPFPIWSDDDCLDATACTLILDELRQSITATFATQHVFARLHGPGHVSSDPPGLECDSTATPDEPPPCGAEFPTGQVVTLTALEDGATWMPGTDPTRAGCDVSEGPVCQVIAERSRWTIVSFAGAPIDQQYPPTAGARFRVRKSGNGSGNVSGGGIDCGSRCSVDKNFGDRIVLLADASSGSHFVGWRHGCGGSARCRLTVGPTTRVTAVFGPSASATSTTTTETPIVTPLQARLDRVKVRRLGRRYRIVLSLNVNLAATVQARVTTRRRRGVLRRSWGLQPGDRRLTLRVRARPGRYRLVLRIRSADGQLQRIQRTLRLR